MEQACGKETHLHVLAFAYEPSEQDPSDELFHTDLFPALVQGNHTIRNWITKNGITRDGIHGGQTSHGISV